MNVIKEICKCMFLIIVLYGTYLFGNCTEANERLHMLLIEDGKEDRFFNLRRWCYLLSIITLIVETTYFMWYDTKNELCTSMTMFLLNVTAFAGILKTMPIVKSCFLNIVLIIISILVAITGFCTAYFFKGVFF